MNENKKENDFNKNDLTGYENAKDSQFIELSDLFQDQALKSSVRLLILILLALNKRLGFTELLEIIGTGKGSLSNHIDKLVMNGYAKTKTILTLSGPRKVVEITEKGMQVYEKYLMIMEKLNKNIARS
ncbi:MAG TPA: MarR family winged helix-turn-helix transcriptional regulator [Geobacterales bacterium]|nr:MarR family winged helix-turn-helix transcriptional regulator [Geobacterales bacterium]